MKNQYVGDIGDYGKLGMLRNLQKGFSLGVNWYLTPNDNTTDGRHTQFLKITLDTPDKQLHDYLNEIVKKDCRNVLSLQDENLLPRTTFFSDKLDFNGNNMREERILLRREWHEKALEYLKGCELVFLDPDNGLEIKSTKAYYLKGNKYTTYGEACDFFRTGSSVIIYNHRDRSTEEKYIKRFNKFKNKTETKEAHLLCFRFSKISVRDYLFIIHDEHFTRIKTILDEMLQTGWKYYFSYRDISDVGKG